MPINELFVRALWLSLAVFMTPQAFAQKCAEFEQSQGKLIQFNIDGIQRNLGRFRDVGRKAQDRTPVPYEDVAGKRGRILGKVKSSDGISAFVEVILDDCSHVFVFDLLDNGLDDVDAYSKGFSFLIATADPANPAGPPVYKPSADVDQQEWEVQTSVDPMTDAKTCSVSKGPLPYPMLMYSKNGWFAGAVFGDFPGRAVRFRVDDKPPISEIKGLSGPRVRLLLSQLRAGARTIRVGAYQWPKDFEQVREYQVADLVAKLDQCVAFVEGK